MGGRQLDTWLLIAHESEKTVGLDLSLAHVFSIQIQFAGEQTPPESLSYGRRERVSSTVFRRTPKDAPF